MAIQTFLLSTRTAAHDGAAGVLRRSVVWGRVPGVCLSLVMLAALGACGGGGGSGTTVTSVAPVVTPPRDTGPAAGTGTATTAATVTCYNGAVANTPGAEDPFYVNTWALKNTGPNQIVSAAGNNGVAGIDANVENVHKAGKGCTGKGVLIAIVDSALEIGHEDLVDNVVAGKSFNFADNTNDPSPTPNQTSLDHGTGVAGVAAARGWNGKGSRGTGPFASLVGYPTVGITPLASTNFSDITYLSFGAKALADATAAVVGLFGNRADATAIFNYSAGADYAAPPAVNDLSSSALAAKWGTSNLRGGLGAVYFQATGNEYSSMTGGLPDGTRIPVDCPATLISDAKLLGGELSNIRGMSCGNPNQEPGMKPYFYQVAAMHNTGKASSYSNSGAANWIAGFGGEFGTEEAAMITTDNSGCASGGNNAATKSNLAAQLGEILNKLIADLFGDATSKDPNCNYTGRMNGTSAATPSVSGVTSLILEANPTLTWQDVGFILAKTARRVDTTIATGANAVTYLSAGAAIPWNLDDPWITNAAGFNFQNRYGFGMIDADAAVQLAVAYTPPPGRRAAPLVATGSASTTLLVDRAVGVNVANVAFASSGATTGPLRLDLTLNNNTGVDVNPGFLQFIMENTVTGTKSIVLPAFTSWYVGGKTFPIKAGGQQQFRFQTNAFYGETIAGNYKVYVVDFSGSSGASGKTLSFTPTLTSFSM
jgi:subtilisin family serine protease